MSDITESFNAFVRKIGPAFGRTPWFLAVQPKDAGALSCSNLPDNRLQLEFLENLCRSFRNDAPTVIINEKMPGGESIKPPSPGFTAVMGEAVKAGDTITLAYDPINGKMTARRC